VRASLWFAQSDWFLGTLPRSGPSPAVAAAYIGAIS